MTTTTAETAAKLLSFINTEVSISPDPMACTMAKRSSSDVDSLGVIRITQWMEDELGVEVDPSDVTLDNFQTVSRMMVYLGAAAAS